MIGGLIVTHGRVASELLTTAQTIESGLQKTEAIALDWSDSVEDCKLRIQQALERLLEDVNGVIIFTDMFGGTPSNISLAFLESKRVEIITGVNLPMIVRFGSLQSGGDDATELAHMIRDKGARSIRVASDLLTGQPTGAGS